MNRDESDEADVEQHADIKVPLRGASIGPCKIRDVGPARASLILPDEMEELYVGRVTVTAVIDSLEDIYRVYRGNLPADQSRRIEVTDALVDTGATGLSLPSRMVQTLGLVLCPS